MAIDQLKENIQVNLPPASTDVMLELGVKSPCLLTAELSQDDHSCKSAVGKKYSWDRPPGECHPFPES